MLPAHDNFWPIAAFIFLTLSLVLFLLGSSISKYENNYENYLNQDCRSKNGEVVYGGKYGDDMCFIDGKMVKVYRR